MSLAVGDRVTVTTRPEDPIEITVHTHAVVVDVEDRPDGAHYHVGHPPAPGCFGPYPEGRLTRGWVMRR